MSRVHPTPHRPKNPSMRYYEWKNNSFQCYDIAKKKSFTFNHTLSELVILEEYVTIKGWDEVSKSNIYSNTIYNTATDRLYIQSAAGGRLATGMYWEIKEALKRIGGVFYKIIYAYHRDTIITIGIKGTGVYNYAQFFKDNASDIQTHYVTASQGIATHKTTHNIFTYPKFSLDKRIESAQDIDADRAADIVRVYFEDLKAYNSIKNEEPKVNTSSLYEIGMQVVLPEKTKAVDIPAEGFSEADLAYQPVYKKEDKNKLPWN